MCKKGVSFTLVAYQTSTAVWAFQTSYHARLAYSSIRIHSNWTIFNTFSLIYKCWMITNSTRKKVNAFQTFKETLLTNHLRTVLEISNWAINPACLNIKKELIPLRFYLYLFFTLSGLRNREFSHLGVLLMMSEQSIPAKFSMQWHIPFKQKPLWLQSFRHSEAFSEQYAAKSPGHNAFPIT